MFILYRNDDDATKPIMEEFRPSTNLIYIITAYYATCRDELLKGLTVSLRDHDAQKASHAHSFRVKYPYL